MPDQVVSDYIEEKILGPFEGTFCNTCSHCPELDLSTQGIGGSAHVFHHQNSFLPGARLELAWEFNVPTDFKSVASADFAIRAKKTLIVRNKIRKK